MFLWGGECGCESVEEVEQCFAEAAVCLEDCGGDGVGVVFATLV